MREGGTLAGRPECQSIDSLFTWSWNEFWERVLSFRRADWLRQTSKIFMSAHSFWRHCLIWEERWLKFPCSWEGEKCSFDHTSLYFLFPLPRSDKSTIDLDLFLENTLLRECRQLEIEFFLFLESGSLGKITCWLKYHFFEIFHTAQQLFFSLLILIYFVKSLLLR